MSKHRRSISHSVTIIAVVFGSLLIGAGLQPIGATDVCGEVCDEAWDLPGSPYTATCSITVPSGCSLTIEPGVEVEFQTGLFFSIGGYLDIAGVAIDEVVLRSASATPAPGDWGGLNLGTGSEATLRHVRILHATEGIDANDTLTTVLENVTARENVIGLRVRGASTVEASWCTFTDNDEYGIHLWSTDDPTVTITRSSIHDNGPEYDVYLFSMASGQVIHARENWWGSMDPALITSRIRDAADGGDNASVDWCGYLDRTPDMGVPARDAHCPDLRVCDGTTVWDLTDKPYQMVSDVFVCPTGTLEINAGVEVRAVPGSSSTLNLRVEGALDVNGTAGSPATFTTDAMVPAVGDWGGLLLTEGGTAFLDHAEITYSGSAIEMYGFGNAVMNNVTARWNNHGLMLNCTSLGPACNDSVIQASGCTLTDNAYTGISATGGIGANVPGPSVSISGSSIHTNGTDDVQVSTLGFTRDFVIDARDNWWNAIDPMEIAARISDHPYGGRVNWCGWLSEAPPAGSRVSTVHCPDLLICDDTALWDATDEPYLLVTSLNVCATGTLAIGPGVEVRSLVAPSKPGIFVHGELDVNGEPASPVDFVADAGIPLAGDWAGMVFRGGSTGTLDHARIMHATEGINVRDTSNVTLNGVTIRENQTGLSIDGYWPMVVNAFGCTITDNEQHGVEIQGTTADPDQAVSISGSSLHSNLGDYDLYVGTPFAAPDRTVFEARGNWWGSDDPDVIRARIHDHTDETASPRVDWCAYLDGPGGVAPDVACPQLEICDATVVWDRTDRPYQITGDMRICPTGTLEVRAGVDVRFVRTTPRLGFLIEGALEVNGTEASPVRFTSDSQAPAALDWDGFEFVAGSMGDLYYATVEYGDRGIDATGNAHLTLDWVTARRNRYGLYVDGTGPPTVAVTGSTFTENTWYGVYLIGNPNPNVTITSSSLYGNHGTQDLYTHGYSAPATDVLMMRDNWWGSVDPAEIGPRIHDQRNNTGAPRVDWCHYLDGPPPGGVRAKDVHCPELIACDATVTWDLTDKPYQIVTDVWVCPTGTLEIGPGVDVRVVRTTPQPDFFVDGILDVNGTTAAPVVLRSDDDAPQARDWTGLRFRGSSVGHLEHVTVQDADRGIDATGGAQVNLAWVTARRNRYGLYVDGTGPPTVNVTGSAFIDNTSYGVYLVGNPNPDVTITNSSLYGNHGTRDLFIHGYSSPGTYVQLMRDNWWGSAEPEDIGPRIRDRRYNTSAPRVDWCRYLDGPPPGGTPARDVHCPDLVACDATVTWDLTDKPYQIVTDVWVCPTGTLEIGSGVEARVASTTPQPELLVDGVLDVNGTEELPVVLTSDADTPQAQSWIGLRFRGSSQGYLEHATVEYADRGIDLVGEAQVNLDNVTVRRNRYGLYVDGTGPPTADVSGSTFTDNTSYGVYLMGNPNPDVTIASSALYGNQGSYDLYTHGYSSPGAYVQLMRDNWWGSAEPELIGPRIYDGRTNTASPRVDWCHYLDGPPPGGVRARDVHCPDLVACDDTVTWDLTDKPYQIVTDVWVCPTGWLEIGPGVEARMVKTTPQPNFLVEGILDVNGTEVSPVLLTSDAATPQAQDWIGLEFRGASEGTLEHATVEYADHGVDVAGSAQVTLGRVTARRNRYGLYVDGNGPPTAVVTRSTFTDNTYHGVHLVGNPNPDVTITTSSLYGNLGGYDLFAAPYASPATSVVWATDNWWDTTDENEISARIYDNAENSGCPHVHFQAFGEHCEMALGRDRDVDGLPDFDDNCPDVVNAYQVDGDHDGMGDPCDPEPATTPWGECDGFEDMLDGYADADGDGWGDPCDHRPLRDDSYPGAPERCDARDNDGDGLLGFDERIDEDLDLNVVCGDCDDLEPLAQVCLCEQCGNALDDDCDGLADGGDLECVDYPSCVVVETGTDPWLSMGKGECGGATLSGPYDVIRGRLAELAFDAGHVDLGAVSCVAGGLDWDRVTDWSLNPNPACEAMPVLFYVGQNTGDTDFGAASSGEPRDTMNPDPACP